MTKPKMKYDSLPQHLKQKADSVQAKEAVSFDQSMGRIIDGEPLPGDEQIVIQHLMSHPQCVQQVECHLAIDAMLFAEARCDSLAFVESVRVAIEAEETKSVFARSVSVEGHSWFT